MNRQLIQYLREDLNSFRNLKQKVKTDMEAAKKSAAWDKAVKAIDTYRNGAYYASKTARLQALETETEEVILIGLMAVAMQPQEITPIQSICSFMSKYLGDNLDAVKTAAEIVVIMAKEDLVDLYPAGVYAQSITIGKKLDLSSKTKQIMERIHYPAPMICKPREIISEVDRSHLCLEGHMILGKEHQHDDYICLDVINQLNGIELELDENILEYEEIPPKKLGEESVKQFEKLNTDSTKIYQELLDLGNQFHLTWKYDFRGRMYSQGYNVNLQSYDYKRSLISLKAKRKIT